MKKKLKLLFYTALIIFGLARAENNYYFLYLQGNSFEDVKDYQQAISSYAQSIVLEPGFAPAYNGLGFVYLELKDFPKAKENFLKAHTLEERFILPIINLGAVYYRENNYAEAEKYFFKALELDKDNPRALMNIAVIKYRLNDLWGAFDYYQKAKSADENYLRERYNKEKTLAEIRSARQKDPGNLELQILEEKVKNEAVYLP